MGCHGRGALKSDAELRAILLLRLLPGVGDRTAIRLLRAQGSAVRALSLPAPRFAVATGSPGAEEARRDPELTRRVEEILARCGALAIRVIPFGHPDYPGPLLALADPPPVLFLRGDPSLLRNRAVAVVGSRRATPVGRRTAERLARGLSEHGVTIVSGLAFGIDGAAHRGGLAGQGRTVAVMGSGPDRPHPAGHRDLFRRILREGLVVSEFPPGEPARPFHFPRRNRVLAALSGAVVVVQAARRSGALITVDHALDLGLDVFAVPGSVETVQAEGTNSLIREGAHLLTGANELLEILGWAPALPARPRGAGTAAPPRPGGAPEEGAIRAVLAETPSSLDDLVRRLRLPPGRILPALTRLEIAGLVARDSDGWRRP